MLQIITGKFYDNEDRFHNDCRGILYSNISFSGIREIGHIRLQRAEACENIKAYIVSYDNQLQKSHNGLELIKVGDKEILHQTKNILSFTLDAFFDDDKSTVERICKKNENASNRYPVASEFIPGLLDIGKNVSDNDLNNSKSFFSHLMTLGRKDYINILNCIVAYNASIGLLSEDVSLAYTMLVYCLESLSQSYDAYAPTWEDYKEDKKKALEKVFKVIGEENAETIKEILIKDEHLKLSKRFKEFVIKYIGENFFNYDEKRNVIGKEDFDIALANAYNSRSQYVHMLKPVMKHLTMAEFSKSGDFFVYQHNIFFTYSGLLRVAKSVIQNFALSLPAVEQEIFDWRGALPGCFEFEAAPYYWIWKMDSYKGEGARARVEGFVETFVHYKNNIPQMDDLIKMYLAHLGEMKEENKLAAFTLCCLYVGKIGNVEEDTKNLFNTVFDKYKLMLDKCSIYTLVLLVMKVNLYISVAWETVECEKIVNAYCKKRYKANRLKLPKVIETMIYLEVANSFNQENEKEDRKRWMWRAYNNSNNSTAIQNMIKDCMETEDIFDIDSIWQVVNKKFTNQEN